jgi:hypothetical protein
MSPSKSPEQNSHSNGPAGKELRSGEWLPSGMLARADYGWPSNHCVEFRAFNLAEQLGELNIPHTSEASRSKSV